MSDQSKKIAEILSNESICEAFAACSTVADAVKLLAEHGVETTENELKDVLAQMLKSASGALSEENLEQVAGGSGEVTIPSFDPGDILKKLAESSSDWETGSTTIYA